MSTSIEQRLSRTLAVVIALAGLSSALLNFIFAYHEAEEFQDDTLRQIALLALRSGWNPRLPAPLDEPLAGYAPSRLIVVREPPGRMPDWIPPGLSAGFHTLASGPERMRVFVQDNVWGERIVVAQSTQLRDDIAFENALPSLIPLLLTVPILALLAVFIVRSELARVRELAENLDRSPPDRFEALATANVPAEVAFFVAAINRLMARVNRLVEQQRRFVADAAHELRSPLAALALQAKNVEKAASLQSVRERMASLKDGIHRTHRLAEQLLGLARTQTESPPEKVDVSRLARELIEEHQPLAQERRIDLGLEEREPVEVVAAADTLRLILKNALHNALTYVPAGGEVTVRLFAEDGQAIIEVADNGPGIPVEERERVFAPFYRVPGSPGEGSGLGLAIAASAAARLGGSLKLCDRDPAPGLVFQYRQQRAPCSP